MYIYMFVHIHIYIYIYIYVHRCNLLSFSVTDEEVGNPNRRSWGIIVITSLVLIMNNARNHANHVLLIILY